MIEEIKKHISKNGIPVEQFVSKKYPEGSWSQKGDLIKFESNVAHLNVVFKWQVENDKIIALPGRASDLTPDLYEPHRYIEENRSAISSENLKIYDFVQYRFGETGNMEESFQEAESEFGLDTKTVEAIFLRVDELIYGKKM